MDVKKCFKCGDRKTLDSFYAHPMMKDGHLNKCKECTKKDSTERRNNKLEECRKYDRERGELPHRVKARKDYVQMLKEEFPDRYKEMRYNYTKKYRQKNHKKYIAHSKVRYHLAIGDIKKKPCMICGDNK